MGNESHDPGKRGNGERPGKVPGKRYHPVTLEIANFKIHILQV